MEYENLKDINPVHKLATIMRYILTLPSHLWLRLLSNAFSTDLFTIIILLFSHFSHILPKRWHLEVSKLKGRNETSCWLTGMLLYRWQRQNSLRRTVDCTNRNLRSYCKVLYRLCGLVVRVPCYRTEMYCVSCEVRMNLYVLCRRK
jgi:hypothetical protein